MPIKFQPRFTRQMIPKIKKGGLVIPASAEPLASLPENVLSYINSQPPRPANSFSFHYINYPFTEDIFEDGHKINDGIYEFLLKDAVIAVYDLHSFQNDEFCWSFATTHQTVVLSALNIGKMFDVKLAQPFKKILHISKYHFPSGVPDSGYGQHALHLSVDYSTSQEKGFRILSSYEVGANKTDSRLPFFFGFRVYGFKNVGKRPIWRKFLSDAAIYAQAKDWGTALIQTAFALESFIDSVLFSIFKKADFGEYYGTHLLQVGEKKHEFHALFNKLISKKQINTLYQKVNNDVFHLRNEIAHGKITRESITGDQYIACIKTAVELIWDLDKKARKHLIPVMYQLDPSSLIDHQLINECTRY